MKEAFMLFRFFISNKYIGTMLLIVAICIALRILIIRHMNKKRTKQEAEYLAKKIAEEMKHEEATDYNKDVKNKENYNITYEPKYLMSLNEKSQYRKLRQWANQHSLIIFCKVRLLDLITPRKNQENYKGALWKIQAKHVDFVICDQDIRVKCIVEISDGSHSRQDRADRDNFVTEVLQACGYKVLMTYNVTDEQLNNICGYAQPTKEQEIKHE